MSAREFKLRSTATSTTSHNIMILPAGLSLKDFTPPVRLWRDPSASSSLPVAGQAEKRVVPAGRATKIKTRILNQQEQADLLQDAEQQSLGARGEEEAANAAPWVLEDFDGQHTLQGRLEGGLGGAATGMAGGSRAGYVFFVNQGADFRVIPADRWYRFTARLPFQPLSLEEAEEAMSQRHVDRWATLKKKKRRRDEEGADGEEEEEEDQTEQPVRGLKKLLLGRHADASVMTAKPRRPLAALRQQQPLERIDFDEIFDDDDGDGDGDRELEGDLDEVDPSMPRPTLSKAGRRVRRLLDAKTADQQHRDHDYDYDDDEDEERDPYALSGEGEGDEEEAELEAIRASQTLLAAEPKRTLEAAPSLQRLLPARLASPVATTVLSASKSGTPPGSPPPPPTSTSTSTTINKQMICESDIVNILRAGPCTTKELIRQLRNKLKADAANKDLFRVLVKRLATLLPGAVEEDRLLELKPEYK